MRKKRPKQVEQELQYLLQKVYNKVQNPATADDEPEWVFWCLFLDAVKMFWKLTGEEATTVHMPIAMLRMLQLYVNKTQLNPIDIRDGVMGMTVITDSDSLWFEL